jgi:FkbM family methyltransferase
MRRIFSVIARYIAKKRNKGWVNKLYFALDVFQRKSNNVNFNSKTNGEDRIINIMVTNGLKLVFDVGANVGDFSRGIYSLSPKTKIHAFEIIPTTFTELKRNTSEVQNLVCNNFGLSDETGQLTMHIGESNLVSTAFKIDGMKDHQTYYNQELICDVMKGSEYLNKNKISIVDFLKIDTEGSDLRVIKGFGDEIKKFKVIQFEYGIFNIQSKDLLRDFYTYLSDNGFIVGKIFPNYVDFSLYHFNLENFHGGNFLAVNKNEKSLISDFVNK